MPDTTFQKANGLFLPFAYEAFFKLQMHGAVFVVFTFDFLVVFAYWFQSLVMVVLR